MSIPLDSNYNDAEAVQRTSFKKPVSGGYQFICVNIEESTSKAGNSMVIIWLDIAVGEFKNCFEKFPLKYYQLCTGDQTEYFKGVMKAFHDSNPVHRPFVVNNEFDSGRLVKLNVGGCLGEEEYVDKNGDVKSSMKVAYLCGTERVTKGEIMPIPIKTVTRSNNDFAGDAPMGNNQYSESSPPLQDGLDLPY